MANYTIIGNGLKIKVKISLNQFEGYKPYFSITGEVYEHTGRPGRPRNIACGCVHDYIKQVTDRFNDVIGLHLSDNNGEPMHVLSNGRFWLGLTKYQPFHKEHTMAHFRITEEELPALLKAAEQGTLENLIDNVYRPRWKQEADAIIRKYNLVVKKEA